MAEVRNSLATTLASTGRTDEALEESRKSNQIRLRTVGPGHLHYGRGLTRLAQILTDAREFEEAERTARESVRIVQAAVGRVNANSANALNTLGRVQLIWGRGAEAEATFREALSVSMELHESDTHPTIAGQRLNVAAALYLQRKFEQSEKYYKAALEVFVENYGTTHTAVALVHGNLAALYLDMERYEEAIAACDTAIGIRRDLNQGEQRRALEARGNRAAALAHLGKVAEAESERRDIIRILERQGPADDPWLALNRARLALALVDLERGAEAAELAELALERARKDGLTPLDHGELLMALARSTVAADSSRDALGRARTSAERAVQFFVQGGTDASKHAEDTREWLRAHPL